MAKKERKLDRHQLVSIAAGTVVVMLLTYLLIAHTPLRRTIPGYPSKETQQAALENFQKVDSLEKVIGLWAFQVANIQRIATGREPLPLDSLRLESTDAGPDEAQRAAFETSDSLLRAQVEQLDAERINAPGPERIEALEKLKFSRPLKGTVKEAFSQTGSHPYTEVSAPSGTQVSAVLDGIIVSADWNEVEGCTLKMQHENDLTSFYRHAGKLLKSVGERVKAGTPIAVVGETGELSQAHILIELRYKNQSIDPALYIQF
ncbi:MAG: M23 family metallopeptidase [Bacteroidales bacterium]|nr:M23 family metallopeptidase [Bacteroidales bacterium]